MFALSPFNSTLLDVPRAHVDPIHSLVEALSVIALAVERPLHDSITALLLDAHHRGISLIKTSKPLRNAAHLIIGEASQLQTAQYVVLATTRPRQSVAFADGDDYLAITQLFSHAGIPLIEWVVLGRGGLYCPRSLTDMPSRWNTFT